MIQELLLGILNMQASSKKSKAKKVINNLEINKGDYIIDIGTGGGYFSYKFASLVGNQGKVYAVDVDERNLRYVEKKAKIKGLNIETCLVKGNEAYIPSEKVDIVFLRHVFHDVKDIGVNYFKKIASILKEDGKVAIIDFINDGKSRESITGHCSDEDEIVLIMEKCGFVRYKKYDYLIKQSYNIFKLKNTMNRVSLRRLEDCDISMFKKWVYKEHVAKWYTEPIDWLNEIAKKDTEYNWIKHFIVEAEGVPIGFCQYYDYSFGEETWHGNMDVEGTYSIDYLIGETDYLGRGLGTSIVLNLVNEIQNNTDAKKIIVQPEVENKASRNTLFLCYF